MLRFAGCLCLSFSFKAVVRLAEASQDLSTNTARDTGTPMWMAKSDAHVGWAPSTGLDYLSCESASLKALLRANLGNHKPHISYLHLIPSLDKPTSHSFHFILHLFFLVLLRYWGNTSPYLAILYNPYATRFSLSMTEAQKPSRIQVRPDHGWTCSGLLLRNFYSMFRV